ncbi:MAG TPA: GntR family transcriptional regulator [Vicinamibacteria bacterium]
MSRGNLSPRIAFQIVEHIRAHDLRRGQHLPAQALADSFRVSRAPVTAALKLLEDLHIVRSERNRGFYLERNAQELGGFSLPVDEDGEAWPYSAVAEDRLSGRLPDRISENELMRLYRVPRGRLLKVLNRIAHEGWIERLPGHGWEFRPMLASKESYDMGYRFRAAIESAAVLEPTFRVDPAAFKAARERQQALLDGELQRLSRSQLFQINSQFHETIVACSGNEFFLDALKRMNRLRRLMEYRLAVDRSRLTRQCREHLEILDRLERGSRSAAARFLRKHIEGARRIKTRSE